MGLIIKAQDHWHDNWQS